MPINIIATLACTAIDYLDTALKKRYYYGAIYRNELKSLSNAYDTDQYAGVRLAVPKFFINGREPDGRSVDAWSKVIDEEIAKAKGNQE